MCQDGQPASVRDALIMLEQALGYLAGADSAMLTAAEQAESLRALERAGARHTAARARMLSSFMATDGYEDDGQGSARTWLAWQTRVTRAAASGAVGWARRLAAHPVIADGMAAGELSDSWARLICAWTDRLPADRRRDADDILVHAAAGGADVRDLAGLAEEMYRRLAGPDADGDDGFDDRYLNLGLTWRGAGHAEGDLTPGCAAALGAVLDALGKKAGPEDTRTARQRRHDALEEACRRLIAAGMVPGRAGQPTHIQVHMTLSQLRDLPGAPEAERAWAAARASEPGWLTGPEAGAAACDATIIPVVTGHVGPQALDRLTEILTGRSYRDRGPASGGPLSAVSQRRLGGALLGLAAGALSGPGGLAAHLRAGLGGPLATPSLPLDIGAAGETIPVHLRRAVATRHPYCAFPGCDAPAGACHIHHLVARAKGGATALGNLVPLCGFHHLVAVHRWGWRLTLNPDGTTTATNPAGSRTLHSHAPPGHAPPGHAA